MYKIQFSDKVSNIVLAARFDSMVRNFFEMFLRARRALEFSHSQDPQETLVAQDFRSAKGLFVSGKREPAELAPGGLLDARWGIGATG